MKIRTLLLPIIALAIMIALGACSNEELLQDVKPDATPQGEGRAILLTAAMPGEDPATRVGLTQEANKSITLTWEADDELKLVFVQGATKATNTAKIASLSEDKKKATFKIYTPTSINLREVFDLYGVYGSGTINIAGTNPVVNLPTNAGSATSLADVQNRKDVMLSFATKDIDITTGNITTAFSHLGSLFSITLKNTGTTSLDNLQEAQIVGIDNGDNLNWAYNAATGGQSYDLVAGEFLNPASAGNYISFAASQNSIPAESTITFWAWYPPLTGKSWPKLQLQLKDATTTPMAIGTNALPAKNSGTAAAKSYYFYAAWDGTALNFTDESYSSELTVDVAEMGTLSTLLSATQKTTITKLTVTGQINKADYDVMRNEMPNLMVVDLSLVTSYEGTTKNKMPQDAFGGAGANTTITSVILPNTLTAIGISAFEVCTGLTGNLIIPEGVTTIDEYAFKSCTNLTGALTIPDKVTTIKFEAFRGCTGFTGSLTIPNSVTTIGKNGFDDCINITEFQFLRTSPINYTANMLPSDKLVKVPVGSVAPYKGTNGWFPRHPIIGADGQAVAEVATMGALGSLFSDSDKASITKLTLTGQINKADFEVMKKEMPKLTYIDLKEVMCEDNKIPSSAFGQGEYSSDKPNTTISTVIFPKSITRIEHRAFHECIGLTGPLTIPDKVTIIDAYAFMDCKGLTGILKLPSDLKKISVQAFANCVGFTGLTISDKLAEIGHAAFFGCENISGTLVLPASVYFIDERAFAGCSIDTFQLRRIDPIVYRLYMFYPGVTVKVPASAVSKYKAAPGWDIYKIVGY